jgi:hypothetical protein
MKRTLCVGALVAASLVSSACGSAGPDDRADQSESDLSRCGGTKPVAPVCNTAVCDAEGFWEIDPLPAGTVCKTVGRCDGDGSCVGLTDSGTDSGAFASCSTTTCNGPAACSTQCLDTDGAVKACNAWSFDHADDADLDGIPDTLERALARRYAPKLHLRPTTWNGTPGGDLGQIYGFGQFGNAPGSDWQFVVRPVTPYFDNEVTFGGRLVGQIQSCAELYQCLEIVYILPYNWDLGDDLDHGEFTSHRGDGEMYSVLVTRKDPLWRINGVLHTPDFDTPFSIAKSDPTAWRAHDEFVSEHMCAANVAGEPSDSSHFRTNLFSPTVPAGGGTELWVSEGKHANYFSADECDAGGVCIGGCTDSCNGNTFVLDPGVQFAGDGPLRNAGEEICSSHPSLDPITTMPGATPETRNGGTYNVWSDQPFGDDHEGRGTALLRANTLDWWHGNHRCW